MADATQVQRRRGTESQCDGMTPAEAEVIVDLTNDTLRVGDGVRAGGFIMPNFNQLQTQQFVYAVAGGTGNAITVDLAPALIGYVGGTSIEFRASNNNTGAATININGLGARDIYKLSGGALVPVASGDIVSGVVYRVTYDGTQFQVTNAEFSPPAPTGGWSLISTTTASGTSFDIVLPNGYTSFRIEASDIGNNSTGVSMNTNFSGSGAGLTGAYSTGGGTPPARNLALIEITRNLSNTRFVFKSVWYGVSGSLTDASGTGTSISAVTCASTSTGPTTGTIKLYGLS